jgi:hypothetical protein
MRSLCATLVFLFACYTIGSAAEQLLDPKVIETTSGVVLTLLLVGFGILIALTSKRIAIWLTSEFDDPPVNDSRIAPTLVRLFGCYVVWVTAPSMFQWIFWFFGGGAIANYDMNRNAAQLVGFVQTLVPTLNVIFGVFLALMPERVLRWVGRFDKK